MAAYDQPILSTSDTTTRYRVVTDAIFNLDPMSTPFLVWLGLASANKKFNFVNAKATQIEWLEDQYRAQTGTLSATCTSTGTALTVSDASAFKKGMVLLAPDGGEHIRVASEPDTTNNTLSVSRGWSGTTNASQATGTLTILYIARDEGDDADFGPVQAISSDYNLTMILEDAVKVSGTQLYLSDYGMSNQMDYQVRKKIKELARDLERAAFYALRTSSGAVRSMGGLGQYVTTNTISTSALTLSHLEAIILSCYQATEQWPRHIWMNPARLQTIQNLWNSTSYLRIEASQGSIGMNIAKLVTPWGEAAFHSSIHCPTTKLFFLNEENVGGYTLRPWSEADLPSDGDYEARDVLGEFSLVVVQEKSHGIITYTG